MGRIGEDLEQKLEAAKARLKKAEAAKFKYETLKVKNGLNRT